MQTPHDLIRERAERILNRRQLARVGRSSIAAAEWRDPRYEAIAWQRELAGVCDDVVAAVLKGDPSSGLFSAPPRHGKTEILGRAAPISAIKGAGDLGQRMSILYVTASSGLAEKVSHQVRTSVEKLYEQTRDPQYAPGRTWGTSSWETAGGHEWNGRGWIGATGGIGCRLLIMDDLIGTSENYRSATNRSRIRRVVQEDLLSRVMDGGSSIHMETRRGTEDTTAWLQEDYGEVWQSHVWRCYDPERGYLWPEKFGERWRAANPHLTDHSSIWRSLYQQEPVPEGGTLIEPDWLRHTYRGDPQELRRAYRKVVVGVDLAATGKTTSDYCVMTVIGISGAYRDVFEVERFRAGYVEQKRRLQELCAHWRPDAVYVELAAGGHGMVDDLKGAIKGITGVSPGSKDKVTRLTPHLPRFAAGQVRTPVQAPWLRTWRQELESFAGTPGERDDQVDSCVWALEAAEQGTKMSYAEGMRALYG